MIGLNGMVGWRGGPAGGAHAPGMRGLSRPAHPTPPAHPSPPPFSAHILSKKVSPRAFVEVPGKKGDAAGEVGIEGTVIEEAVEAREGEGAGVVAWWLGLGGHAGGRRGLGGRRGGQRGRARSAGRRDG